LNALGEKRFISHINPTVPPSAHAMTGGTIKIFVQLIFFAPFSPNEFVYFFLLLKCLIPFIMPIVPTVVHAKITGTNKIAILSTTFPKTKQRVIINLH